MKRTALIVTAVMLLVCAGAYAAEQAEMPVVEAPDVRQVVPAGEDTLAPAVFPDFVAVNQTDNPECEQYLVAQVSGEDILNDTSCFVSAEGNGKPFYRCDRTNGIYKPVQGLTMTYSIPAEYRKSARLTLKWTIRVEGYPHTVAYWPTLCSPWHGDTQFKFPEGDVLTKAVIAYGSSTYETKEYPIRLPDGGVISKNQPADPTVSPEVVLLPGDFGGAFPAEMTIEVHWKNRTSMDIKTPDGQRNMILTFLPVVRVQSE